MPRPAPPDRLDRILKAAAAIFSEKGFRRTQMADIAQLAGVSQGTLYNYVESKDALLHGIVDRCFLDEVPPPPESLPLVAPAPGATLARLRERLEESVVLPSLDAALARRRVGNAARELEEIVRELYRLTHRTRERGRLVERIALELPEIAELWFAEYRERLFDRIALYFRRRIERGHFEPVPDVGAAARLVVETIAWFARHQYDDPYRQVDERAAEETVVHFVVRALISERAPPPEGP